MLRKLYLLLVLILLFSSAVNAQLVINEFSQGNSGVKEFVELVVTGTRTCNDSTADIRGWIIDDNNGWYGGAGTGIAAGNIRFANVTNWQNVPYGSIILLYNSSDKNVNITLADDPTDANHDYVYVVPVSTASTYMEYNNTAPASPSAPAWSYSGLTYSSGANWTTIGLANTGGDAIIVVKPTKPDSAYHSIGYGNASGGTGFHTPYVVKSLVGSQSNCYLTNSSYNNAASWTIGTAGAAGAGDETPGAANTAANSTWITGLRAAPLPVTSSFSQNICQGQSYTYNGIARTATGAYLDTFTTVSGCDSIVTLNLTVTPLPPAPTVTTPVTYCQSSTPATLTATGSNLLWYSNSTGGSGNTTPPAVSTSTAGSTTYYVSQTTGTCESPRAAIVVNVTAKPAIPVVRAYDTACQSPTDSTFMIASGLNLKWYTAATSGTLLNASTPGIYWPHLNNAGTFTYYVSQTVNGCESDRAVQVFTINPIPSAPTVTSPATYCQNSVAPQLTATGSNLLWYGNATGGTGSTTAFTPSTGTAGGTTYYVSQTVNGCESPRVSIVVNITAKPPAPSASASSVCQGTGTYTFTATGSNLLWYTGATGGSGTSTAPSVSLATAATTTYYVSQTVGGCESNRSAISVIVNALPAAPTVTSPVTYCQNSSASQLSASGTNLQWYTAATGGTATTTAPTPLTGTAGSTTWYVSSLSAAGCESARVPLTVNITATPVAPTTTNIILCQGQFTTSLVASGTGTLVWYLSATGGTGNTTPPTPSTSNVGSTTYYVSQFINGCESNRTPLIVTVATTPAAPVVSSPAYLCQNSGTVSLGTYVTGTNLLWYSAAAGGTGTATVPSVNTATLSTTTWYISASAGICETSRVPLVVNVVGKPGKPVITNDSLTYCQNSPVSQFAVTGTNLLWYTTATGGTGSPAAPVLSGATTGTFTWYVSQTVNGCESNRAAATIFVSAQPAPPVVTAVYNYCQFGPSGPLNVTGVNLKWYTTATGGSFSTTTPVVNTQGTGTSDYYVSQTVNGCESPRAHITVNITTRPAPPVVTTPITYCMNAPAVPLTAIGNSLLWYYNPTGGTGTAIPPVPSTLYIDTVSYYVTQSVNGCESPRSELDVYVHYKPNGIILASKSEVCQYDTASFRYFGNAYPSSQYNWKSPLSATTMLNDSGQGPIVIRFDSFGVQTIRMQVNDNGCVSDPAFYNIKVKAAPLVNPVVPHSVCQGEPVQISVNYASPNIQNYGWNFDGAGIQYGSDAGPYSVIWNSAGEHHVTLVATSDNCPSLTHVDTVQVHAIPTAKITGLTSTQICADDIISLQANDADSGSQYSWGPAKYFGNMAYTGPVTAAQISYPGYITLKITNKWGCNGKDSVYVDARPCCDVYLPDAFTPNGDGKNDYFHIITEGSHKITVFRVANRWGQIVFETADETRGWDGSMGGVQQDMGVYYYYLKYTCISGQVIEKRGEVTLIR